MSPKNYLNQLPSAFKNHSFSLSGSEDDEYGGYYISHFSIAPGESGHGQIYLVTRPGESYVVIAERLAEGTSLSDEELLELVQWGLSYKLGSTRKSITELGWPSTVEGAPVPWSTLSPEQQKSFAAAAEVETDGGEYMPDGSEEFYDFLTELFLGTYKRDADDNLLCRSEGPFLYEWSEFRMLQG